MIPDLHHSEVGISLIVETSLLRALTHLVTAFRLGAVIRGVITRVLQLLPTHIHSLLPCLVTNHVLESGVTMQLLDVPE